MANQGLPGGQTAPPNINSLAAQGIQGAGMGTALGMGYTPSQVGVAGQSASVTPTNVTGSNVTGSNVTGSNVTGSNVTGNNVMANQLANTSLAPYMNPYTQQVINANESDILRGANIGMGQLQGQAQAAGAFGGSRHGVAMGDIGRETLQQLAQSSAGLRQAGYANAQNAAFQDIGNNFQGQLANQGVNMQGQLANQANSLQAQGMNQANSLQAQGMNQGNNLQAQLANQQNALQSGLANQNVGMQGQQLNQQAGLQDISNQLQASLANQSAGLQGQQQRLGAANQLGQLSNLGFGMGQQVNRNLSQQGAQQQALQQALFDAAQQQYQGFVNHPAQGLGYVTGALNANPVSTPNTVTQTKTPGLFDYLTLGANAYTGNAA